MTRTSSSPGLRSPGPASCDSLLLVEGENDPRCPVTEAEQLIAELGSRGIPYTYLAVAHEGHGFLRPETNIPPLGWIEDFLGEHPSNSVSATAGRKS